MKPFKEYPGEVFVYEKHDVFLKRMESQGRPVKIDPNLIRHEVFDVEAIGKNIAGVDKSVNDFIRRNRIIQREENLDSDKIMNFSIAVSEAVQNAILHGGENPERLVYITILWIPGVSLYVGVTDNLGQLDFSKINFTAEGAGLDEHGRGMFLMTMLSSAVIYIPK